MCQRSIVHFLAPVHLHRFYWFEGTQSWISEALGSSDDTMNRLHSDKINVGIHYLLAEGDSSQVLEYVFST